MPVIRQQQRAFTQPVGVTRVSTGADQLANKVAQTADQLTGIAFRRAAEEAEKSGSEMALSLDESRITTINPETGKPEPFDPPRGMGRIATEAYQRVINKRFEDSVDRDLRLKAREFAMNNPNPEQYAGVMSEYIASLSANAGGRYSEFIESTGEAYLASTKLNLVAQERENQRRAAAAAAREQRAQAGLTAYELARAGRFEDALLVAARENAGAVDEADAELLGKEELEGASSEMLGAVAAGSAVNLIDSLRGDPAARNAVIYALSTGGLAVEGVPDDIKSRVAEIAELVDMENIRNVLSETNRVNSDLGAMESSFAAIAEQRAEQQARLDIINFDRSMDDYSRSLGNRLHEIYTQTEPENLGMMLSANIASNSLLINQELESLDVQFRDGQIDSESAWRSRRGDVIEAFLRPYGVALAAEGNIDTLKAAIEMGDPRDMAKLSQTQRSMVSAIRGSSFFIDNADDATKYLTDIVGMGSGAARDLQEKTAAAFDFRVSLYEQLAKTANGSEGYDDSSTEALIANVGERVAREEFSDTQGAAFVKDINDSFSIGVLNRLVGSTGMTSSQITELNEYISSGGQRGSGLNPAVRAAGDLILKRSGGDPSAVESHLDELRQNASAIERDRADRDEEARMRLRLVGGGGSSGVAEDRRNAQEIIESQFGIDLGSPESVTPEVYGAIQQMRVVPDSMAVGLKRIAGGTIGPNSQVFMNHYANLSQVINTNGVRTNLFREVLSDTDIALLDYATTVAAQTDETAAQVLSRTLESRNNSVFQERIKLSYPNGFDNFVMDSLGDDNQDPYVVAKLAPVAQYMAEIGRTRDEIKEYILQQAEDQFVESKYVFNPAMPLGSATRSEFALEARYSKDEINEIAKIVNAQLGDGFQFMGLDQIERLDEDSTIRPVFFVPRPSQGMNSADYLTYTLDDQKRIVPYFKQEGGEVVWPMFTDEDLNEYRDSIGAEALRQGLSAFEQFKNERPPAWAQGNWSFGPAPLIGAD